MELMNQAVTHKMFGKGKVISADSTHITVDFSIGEKKFIFPDAFQYYISAEDKGIQHEIAELLAEKMQLAQEMNEKKREEEELIAQKNLVVKVAKKFPRANIAFKCNYCDGGKSDQQVGFYGVCSDETIQNNIVTEHRTWCNSKDCACLQYSDGKLSREELDSICEEGGFVCYESQMLREWKALAGIVQKGENKGKPMKLNQVQTNSLCVLTTRDPLSEERDRYIFAVFLVDSAYEGDKKGEGFVGANLTYRMQLSPQESHALLFWDYHFNLKQPTLVAWNSGLHRYFNDEEAAQILYRIAFLKKGTPEEALAEQFYRYFCTINHVDIVMLKPPMGALQRKKKEAK